MYYIVHAESSMVLDVTADQPDAQQLANYYGCGIYILEGKEIARAWPDPDVDPIVPLDRLAQHP